MPEFTFSFIIPTSGRPESLFCLCDSIRTHTSRPDDLEIVLVIDNDDETSLQFDFAGLHICKVRVAPGTSMGAMNMAGYRASSGRYLMLLNDDVVLQTPAWDDPVLEVFQSYPDGVVLVHINETIFRDTLCTFPFLTRSFCELMGGVCPEGYLRYRIDDHIHNIFDLLVLLGQRRRVFLPDVIFQHVGLTETARGYKYVPDPNIHAIDTRLFETLLPERKRLAISAMEAVDCHFRSEKRRVWKAKLESVSDSVAIRDPRHARKHPADQRPRVTVAVVSADMRSEYAHRCIEQVKAHTRDYDLVIVDNNRGPGFNHAREMNRLLEFCRTDYLVLMDDDVFVEEGWLEGMMRALAPGLGVVTPVHNDRNGKLSYAGVIMQPDDSGYHTHVLNIGDRLQHIETLCSAIMLVDMARCGHIRLDETYSKYFLDIDYGLRLWEKGFRVVCSPWTTVTHLGGGTLEQGSQESSYLFEEQRRHYVRAWVDTRRIHALRRGAWKDIPEFMEIAMLKREIDRLFFEGTRLSRDAFLSRVRTTCQSLSSWPALKNYMASQARLALADRLPRADDPEISIPSILLGASGQQPVLYEAGAHGMNIVLWNARFYALPDDEGIFDYARMCRGGYSRSFEAGDPLRIREMISENRPRLGNGHVAEEMSTPVAAVSTTPPLAVLPLTREPSISRWSRFTRSLRRLVQFLPYLGVLHPPSSRTDNLFDAEHYRTCYPDVAAAGVNPLLHFIFAGAFEGRNPHPLFDTAYYLQRYPDVAAAGVNPLAHYLKHGAAEGRQPHPLFDPVYYRGRYPDVREGGINPLVHYLKRGAAEGRQPHPLFDPAAYCASRPDVRKTGTNPLVHYVLQNPENRLPLPPSTQPQFQQLPRTSAQQLY